MILLTTEPNRLGPKFRETLYSQTKGHPLFTVELLRNMEERGALVRDKDGRWTEGPDLDWNALPARVDAVIEERVQRLNKKLREILTIASVEGEEFTAEVVARIQKEEVRELIKLLSRELDKRHHLVSAKGIRQLEKQRLSSYLFQHILFQRYLYNSLDRWRERSFTKKWEIFWKPSTESRPKRSLSSWPDIFWKQESYPRPSTIFTRREIRPCGCLPARRRLPITIKLWNSL